MSRLTKNLKNKVIDEIKRGSSLGKIVSMTGLGKTTIYYYMKKIRGKKNISIKLDLTNLERIGEIIGIFAGDGYYANDKKRWSRRIKIYFNVKEYNLANYYADSIKLLIGKKPQVFDSNSVRIVQIQSIDFCDFILSYLLFGKRKVETIELRDKNLLKDKVFAKGFLRGLIDSDGYVRKGRKEIYYGSISKKLFNDFLVGLDLFSFQYKTYVQKGRGYCDFYKVRLSGLEVDRFVKIIRPLKAKF